MHVVVSQNKGIHYQGLISDSLGVPKVSSNIRVQFSIIDSMLNGMVLYTENHYLQTDSKGYFVCKIGEGTSTYGMFDSIAWKSERNMFLKTSIDIQGGYQFKYLSTTPFLFVPFSYYSKTAQNAQLANQALELKDSAGNVYRAIKDGSMIQLQQVPKTPVYQPVFRTCGDSLFYAGQSYPTVYLDTGCWFKANLNVGKQILKTTSQTNNQITEKFCINDLPAYCEEFGGLYQWAEAMGYQWNASNSGTLFVNVQTQGICPSGWHIPNFKEYCGIAQYIEPSYDCNNSLISNSVAYSLKTNTNWGYSLQYSSVVSNWVYMFDGGSNSSGFSVLPIPGGTRFLTSTENGAYEAYYWNVSQGSQNFYWYSQGGKDFTGFSIRCRKD